MSSVNEIRSAFLNYYSKHDHQIVPSGPLVPRNDPTLMFTNAGMVPFKDFFTGKSSPPWPRAVTSQKCVRAGGKHNDLDNVGYTARHHTFFEMLGNFSFGDYFKEQAIKLAWDLITKEFGLSPDRLIVTIYADDDVAFDLWRKIAGLPEEKIIRIATSDNFWSMGDTGPCGPCSEIFYDHGDAIFGGPPGSPDEDGDRFVEIWNLVFMQFEQVGADERLALPRPSIDTGMGLERIAAVLQGQHDNYEIDLFKTLIAGVEDVTGAASTEINRASHRVIADHLRAMGFLISDGVLPSNEGRGYVLRRIMRRAMRHAHLLGSEQPVIWRLVPLLLGEMGQAYPELGRAETLMTETIQLEEQKFQKTLARGISLLDDATAGFDKGDILDGETAFKLYDTYGFPLDLTQDALKNRDIGVDLMGFNDALERQRAEARASWQGSGDAATETIWLALRDRLGATEFLGYETEKAAGLVEAVVADGSEVDALGTGEDGAVIVNQTPFYAESGGQVGDLGTIETDEGARFQVSDTQKRGDGLFVHYGRMVVGTLSKGAAVSLSVEGDRRAMVRANHSATHLVHEALRKILGGHVAQKGSLVTPDRFRFDFSHPKPVSRDEIRRAEDIANAIILQDAPVETRLMDRDSAIEAGAMALFGEKYGDEVRVVSMGREQDDDLADGTGAGVYSLELCGGTHVGRTGEIGLVVLTNEGAVASGVRRLEALTGDAARHYLADQDARIRTIADKLKVRPDDVVDRIEALIAERKRLERELAEAKRAVALGGGGAGQDDGEAIRKIGSFNLLVRSVDGVSPKDLRGLVDHGKTSVGSGIVAIVGISDGKAGLVVGVTDDLTDRISAVDLARLGSVALGGKGGGGRPDLAQAGGPDIDGADKALADIANRIEEIAA